MLMLPDDWLGGGGGGGKGGSMASAFLQPACLSLGMFLHFTFCSDTCNKFLLLRNGRKQSTSVTIAVTVRVYYVQTYQKLSFKL